MHAFFGGTLWFLTLLQRDDTREVIHSATKALEIAALDSFTQNG
jgi:hypothetical protein